MKLRTRTVVLSVIVALIMILAIHSAGVQAGSRYEPAPSGRIHILE
ncbi:MAG: hypothetical protein SF162_03320 [bacterium]|nr:hypothetical protein [bacterium]